MSSCLILRHSLLQHKRVDGTSWTEGNDLNTAKRFPGGAGANAEAVVAFGGRTPPSTNHAQTESYNGTSWTEVNDMNRSY